MVGVYSIILERENISVLKCKDIIIDLHNTEGELANETPIYYKLKLK